MGEKRVMKVVCVRWIDSEVLGEWREIKELPGALDELVTVGMLLEVTADAYIIAGSYDPQNDSANAVMWIPKAAVRHVEPLATVNLFV